MFTNRTAHIALSFSILSVLELRFVYYTNIFGLAGMPLFPMMITFLMSLIALLVLVSKENIDLKRKICFSILYTLLCIILNSAYLVFVRPGNAPVKLILLQSVILFGISSLISSVLVFTIKAIRKPHK
jgi:hypothetical protein